MDQEMLMADRTARPRTGSRPGGYDEAMEDGKQEMGESGEASSNDDHSQRRAVDATLEIWRQAVGRGSLPRLADIRVRYDGDGWEDRFLLIEDPKPAASVFILCGTSVRRALGGPVVGRSLEEVIPPGGEQLIEACVTALRERVPVKVAGTLQGQAGEDLFYRAIFLPILGNKGAPGYVLGTFGWRRQPMTTGRRH